MEGGACTSAAPTYFPTVNGYIDGGVVANNPSLAALAQTQDRRTVPVPPSLDKIVMLSVGTGLSLLRIEGKRLNWGAAQWAKPLLNIMLDGVAGVADYRCRRVLGDRYCRLAPAFPPGQAIPLDAVDRIPDLVRLGMAVDVSGAVAWLRRVWC